MNHDHDDDPRIDAALAELGWDLMDAGMTWRYRLTLRWAQARHLILGCSPLPFRMWDSHSGRLVEVGTICPVCEIAL